MALTRKSLAVMGIEEDKIDEIINLHSETVNGLKAEIDKYNEDVKKFRRDMDWDKVEAVRKRFADEGIAIHIVKTEPSRYTDPEDIDYAFKLAKAMGAVGVTDELSQEAVEKIAPFFLKRINNVFSVFYRAFFVKFNAVNICYF